MRRVVTLSEHATVKFTDQRLSGLGEEYFDSLHAHLEASHSTRPLSVHRDHVKAGSHVGTMLFKGRQFEILPKLLGSDSDESHSKVYKNLIAILSLTNDIKISPTEVQELGRTSGSLLEIYIELFSMSLERELILRPNKGYVQVEENIGCVKGSIVFPKHIALNYLHKERTYCRFDEFSENNELNKLFKFVVRRLLNVVEGERAFNKLKRISAMLADVDDDTFGSQRASKICLSRLNLNYEVSLNLAKMFVAGFSPEPRAGKNNSMGILFDMNRVFEDFIYSMLQKHSNEFAYEVKSQKKSSLSESYCDLGADGFSEKKSFGTRSDIVITLSDGSIIVIDTKYKKLDLRQNPSMDVSNADVYQILAYASILSKPNVRVLPVLLYPHPDSGQDEEVVRMFRTSGEDEKAFLVMSISMFRDLSNPKERHRIVSEIIHRCVESFQSV